ncbi:MAG: hypothetical protein LBN18_01410, partial [Dysgonamonadaceae bacterium]|nr:hypothetical protein [Dysgonamonadaceae bacterium]
MKRKINLMKRMTMLCLGIVFSVSAVWSQNCHIAIENGGRTLFYSFGSTGIENEYELKLESEDYFKLVNPNFNMTPPLPATAWAAQDANGDGYAKTWAATFQSAATPNLISAYAFVEFETSVYVEFNSELFLSGDEIDWTQVCTQ